MPRTAAAGLRGAFWPLAGGRRLRFTIHLCFRRGSGRARQDGRPMPDRHIYPHRSKLITMPLVHATSSPKCAILRRALSALANGCQPYREHSIFALGSKIHVALTLCDLQ